MAEVKHIAVFQKSRRLYYRGYFNAKQRPVLRGRFQHRYSFTVSIIPNPVFVADIIIAQHMIHMQMGINQLYRPEPLLTDKPVQIIFFVFRNAGSIYEQALGCFIVQNIAIYPKCIENKTFYLNHKALIKIIFQPQRYQLCIAGHRYKKAENIIATLACLKFCIKIMFQMNGKRLVLLIIGIFAGLVLNPFSLRAQFYTGSQMSFGKNRVQYLDYFWTYYKFDKFDVYFYLNGKELALHTARYAESCIPGIEKKLESTIDTKEKIQFLVYNTLNDLRQSNIGLLSNEQYNTGGVTHIIGHKVFLYFDGDLNHLNQQIRSGIAKIMLEKMIYGETLGSQMKSSAVLNLPDWYVEGLVSYLGNEWDTEMDDKVRDGILSGRFLKFNHLKGEDATTVGHSVWYYISQKYGESFIPNIVYMTRVSRGVESGFLYVLGISYKTLMNDWKAWYESKYKEAGAYTSYGPSPSIRIKSDRVYDKVKISPDGEKMLYVCNNNGLYKIFIYDLSTGKKHRILRKGYRQDEKTDYTYPLLAWHPGSGVAAMITERKGLLWLYFYDLETGKWTKQNIFGFQKITDFSYSPDGRMFVFSAVQRGESDIFLYNIAANSAEQLTRDNFNDLYPRFLPGTGKIIFSSNRNDDTLRFEKDIPLKYTGQENNDLFLIDVASKNRKLSRVTSSPLANEVQAMPYSPGSFTYLSDANGIYNRYVARFDSAIAFVDTATHYRYFTRSIPVTNFPRSILSQDVSPMAGKSAEVFTEKSRSRICLSDIAAAGPAAAVQLESTPYLQFAKRKYEAQQAEKDAAKKGQPKVKRKKFSNVYGKEVIPAKDTALIDISNYRIKEITEARSDTSLARRKAAAHETVKDSIPPKVRNYNVEYSINKLISQFDFSFLNASYQPFTGYAGPLYLQPDATVLLSTGATDLLEDYRITGSIKPNFNLKNNEYLISFSNLKSRLDREIFFHRTSYDITYTNALVRHRIHEIHYIVSYPFTETLCLKGTGMLQSDRTIVLSTDQYTLQADDENNYWASLKGELIFDNTRELGINLYEGMRYKFFGEYYQLIDKKSTNIVIAGCDIRHYTKIHRTFIWANRLAASTSFGGNKLMYYLGGVDNWISPGFDYDNSIDNSQDYAFQTLATNMRGFKQNVRNGNSFAVWNSELRFPVFKYFINRPLKSDFLNNFQIVGFADFGSAWKGLNPFSEENTYFTRTIYQEPLKVTVQVQKDPFVAGYGFGLRTRLFGYFIRADWAWGIEDGARQDQIFYLSFSLDF